jgi:hypothetical protein
MRGGRWRPSRYNVPEVMRGPTIHFDRPPCRNPRPSPHWFPGWARRAGARRCRAAALKPACIPWGESSILRHLLQTKAVRWQ